MHFFLLLTFIAREPITQKIALEGVYSFKKSELLDQISLKKGTEFRYPLFKSSLIRLKEFYGRKGFFDCEVIKADHQIKHGSAFLTIKIREGKRKFIQEVKFKGATVLDSFSLVKLLDLKLPTFYDEDLLETREYKIKTHYAEIGYPYMEIKRELEIKGDSLIVYYLLNEGALVIIRKFDIQGNALVRKRIIQREIKLVSDAPYKASSILDAKRRIYATGLFSSVEHKLEELTMDRIDSVQVLFIVSEREPRTFTLGLGYHSPSQLQGEFSLAHNNLFNNAQRIELKGEFLLGLFVSKNNWIDTRRRRLDINYAEPYLLGYPLEGIFHPFYYDDRLFNKEEYGVDFELRKALTSALLLRTTLGWKQILQTRTTGGGTINTIRLNPIYDTRDNIFNPMQGVFASLRLEQAGTFLGGSYDFYRIMTDFTQYLRLTKGGYLAAIRCKIGIGQPFGRSKEFPITERFDLGGEGSVRGYDLYSIGPPHPQDSTRHSGTKLFNLNLELRKQLTRLWGFAIFMDTGYLGDEFKINNKDIAIGVGGGPRFFLPVGPIRVDWGIKLKDLLKIKKGTWGRFYLGIGHMF